MEEVLGDVVYFTVWVGVPVAGLVAALLVAGWPLWSVSRWWSVAFAALATTICAVWTASSWSPGDTLLNSVLISAVALTGGGLTMALLLRQVSPQSHAFGLVRALAAIACALSSVAVVLVALLASEG